MKNVLKNHVAVVLDLSSSMSGLTDSMVKVFNKQIQYLRDSSLRFEQETRVSVYTFSYYNQINCLISDVDVARPMTIDTLRANGNTALLDATALAIEDLQILPQKYGDHAFIVYALTDGEENASKKYNSASFQRLLSSLPENFTICGFVPNMNGIKELKQYGFAAGNIEKWDTTERGMEEVGEKFAKTMDNYFTARSTGTRTSSTMFSDLSQVTASNVSQVLDEIKKKDYEVVINEDVKAVEIKPLVESKTNINYVKGCSFYELVKNETVQVSKKIAIQNKKNGKIYSGDHARQLLSLPNYEVKLTATYNPEWNIYVQSTSVNRKVIPKQRVLVLKRGY